jgi:hypothetical protein
MNYDNYKFNQTEELSEYELKIFEKDKRYRDEWLYSDYRNLKKNSSNDFLYFFCSSYNIKKLGSQISKVFKSGNYDFSSMNYILKFHKLCDIFSSDIKSKFKVFPQNIRDENIKLVNDKQVKDLIESSRSISKIFEENNKKKLELKNRSLVLYFRRRDDGQKQVDYLEFSIMYYIIDWYVNNGYSKLFNNVSVVSRKINKYPQYLNFLFKNFNYLSVTDDDKSNVENFVFVSSIGANIIHFVDGDYWKHIMYCSTPIVSESVKYSRFDSVKYDLIKQNKGIMMKGIFYDKFNENIKNNLSVREKIFSRHHRDKNTGDFYKLMNTILTSVVGLEDKILKDCERIKVFEDMNKKKVERKN